ncbi:MAG: D-aminoacyl-tRNA deacylase [Endomicrobia bacterium]|nr:D-aminoacyl-tRNA deacylase [Endomicrobiia bacterium]
MKIVVQRVNYASVRYDDVEESISKGIVVFVGIGQNDRQENIKSLAKKVVNLRIFENENGKMDKSIKDIDGEVLVISEFTLYGDCRKGNRPDFTQAANLELAEKLYKEFVNEMKNYIAYEKVKTGKFRSHMLVKINNDGPVTILLEN